MKEVCKAIRKNVKVTHNHIHIAPRHVNKITRRMDDVGDDLKSLSKTPYAKAHERLWKKAMKNDQFEDVKD